MNKQEYIAVMKMLTQQARVAQQSQRDCERRGGEMLEQAEDAKHLVNGIAETMEVVTREMKKVNHPPEAG